MSIEDASVHIKTSEIDYQKRQYKRVLTDLAQMIQSELESIGDGDFEPTSAVESTAFRLIQRANQLKALISQAKHNQ
ncbi:hypothetical protein ACQ4M5_22025 [Leptolyngbya sp. AN10]